MVQSAAKKRGSPGADVEKNPLAAVELGDEDARKLQEVQKDIARVELVLGELSSLPCPIHPSKLY